MSLEYRNDEQEEISDEAPEAAHRVPSDFPKYTAIFIACIVAVTAVQFYAGLEHSVAAAGFDKRVFMDRGEFWRILTGAALHGGLMHIFFNSYAFYSFGRLFEFLSSGAHLATVFLLSAIGGGILSLIFMPDGVSVGASGGILGLVSYLAVYAFRRRQFVTAEFRRSLLTNIGFILVFGLILHQVIDNYGHIGGLITGAVYAYFQIPADAYKDPRTAGHFAQAAGLASVGTFIAVSLFAIYLILAA